MKLFVGIDVSSKKLDVCFLDREDARLKETTLPNDINGANQIKESILAYNGNPITKRLLSEWSKHPFIVFIRPIF